MTTTITTAGIDTAKDKLDIAVHGSLRTLKVANDQKGWGKLVRFLKELGIVRAGIEATGGYEQGVTRHFGKAGIDVLVLQPQQVKFYAAFKKSVSRTTRAMPASSPPAPASASRAASRTSASPTSPGTSPFSNRSRRSSRPGSAASNTTATTGSGPRSRPRSRSTRPTGTRKYPGSSIS